MSVCSVTYCIVGRGCLLWPVCSLGKTLLAFVLLHSVLQGQSSLLLQISLDLLLLHSSPFWWKGYPLLLLVLEVLLGFRRTVQLQLLQLYWLGPRLGLLILNGWPWKWTEIILLYLRLYPSTAFQTLLLTIRATQFLLRDAWRQQQRWGSSELNLPVLVHFSSLTPKMWMFTLGFSSLTTSKLPWLMDLTFQVPIQYCSLQHQTLLPSRHIHN